MEIAIDFDGTCVRHEYPNVGSDIGAIPVLKRLVQEGHNLILFTMRSGSELTDAVKWFLVNDIKLYGIQYNPTQAQWTCSNKCYAQLYIDDAALGAPLRLDKDPDIEWSRPYIDWQSVEMILEATGVLEITPRPAYKVNEDFLGTHP